MVSSPQASRTLGFFYLLVTATGWALNWPGMKLLLREWPPLFSRGVAGIAAGAILMTVALWRGDRIGVDRQHLPRLLFAAFTNVFAWMGFGTMAMRWVSVSQGALIVYSMPIWAMLFAWPVLKQRPTPKSVVALVLAMAGIAVLLGGQGFGLGSDKLLGGLLALAASVLFAFGTVVNGKPLPLPPIVSVAWQVGLGCLPMLLLGLAFEKPDFGALDATGWTILVYMTLVPMGVCYLTWFATLRHLPSAAAATGMLLVPLIGVISAALLLGDPLGLREAAALTLTLGGVALALQKT